jgi:hypothetical protein
MLMNYFRSIALSGAKSACAAHGCRPTTINECDCPSWTKLQIISTQDRNHPAHSKTTKPTAPTPPTSGAPSPPIACMHGVGLRLHVLRLEQTCAVLVEQAEAGRLFKFGLELRSVDGFLHRMRLGEIACAWGKSYSVSTATASKFLKASAKM